MKHFKVNQRVMVNPNNDNDNYNGFNKEILIITRVAKNNSQHSGYDDSVSPCYLYDLEKLNGESVNCSLYDYELTEA